MNDFFSQTKQLHKDGICPDDNFLLENEKKTRLAYNIRTDMVIMFLFLIYTEKKAKPFKASFTDGRELYCFD